MTSTEAAPITPASGSISELDARIPAGIRRWIKTECGRAKYLALAEPTGPLARLRLALFVLVAALRDLFVHAPEEDSADTL